ncbi:MAG: glycosyltransferase [Comamonadaceae bacterium]|nr:glycosyltransferase [Comamonadaceae bacterium]
MGMLTAINVPELSPADDTFVHLKTRAELQWIKLSGLPPKGAMRHVMVGRLSRYRAALQMVWHAPRADFIVSHMPRMTAAVSRLLGLRGRRVPHLGFAFNFAELSTGVRYRYMRSAIQCVDQMAVFSQIEREHYARYFDVDPAVFQPVLWSQDPPPVAADSVYRFSAPYLCAVGGEGRDFPLLLEVARRLGPSVTLVVITWPDWLKGPRVPDNVKVLTNIPLAQVWRLASDSCGALVPLRTRDTCCGQITLVSAKLLGLPIVTTWSHATREYMEGREAVLVAEPGDVQAFTDRVREVIDERASLRSATRNDSVPERTVHDLGRWGQYLENSLVPTFAFARR